MPPELHRSISASSSHAEEGLSSESLILSSPYRPVFAHCKVLIHAYCRTYSWAYSAVIVSVSLLFWTLQVDLLYQLSKCLIVE